MALFCLSIADVNIAHLIVGTSNLKVAVNPIPGRSANWVRAVQQMNSKLSNY